MISIVKGNKIQFYKYFFKILILKQCKLIIYKFSTKTFSKNSLQNVFFG